MDAPTMPCRHCGKPLKGTPTAPGGISAGGWDFACTSPMGGEAAREWARVHGITRSMARAAVFDYVRLA